MNLGDVAKRAGVVTGVVAGVAGAVYAGERAVAARIRRGGPDEPADDSLLPEIDEMARIATHDGGELYVIERGPASVAERRAATPIVFAHGITLTSQVWARQFRSLPDAGFRTVAFDGRGHGESTVGETGHSIENLAEDLAAVLTTLDLRDAILVGHSMGGMAVQGLAVHHPDVLAERVRGIVLLSTSPRSFASDARRTRRSLERVVGFVPDVGAVMRQRNLGLLIARVGFGDDPDPRCVEATRQMLGGTSRETMREAGRALLELDFTDELPRLRIPTLVIVGSADLLTPPRESRTIADLVPDAELVELPRAGHMLMYERTEELDRLIGEFARSCLDDRHTVPSAVRSALH
ncbi:MAG TPA: alpha/beta fold hydrolase [Acidimicrobiia bacterium]|nr:alpha/beta fold hydrolase [Acidimicrobiia bacterium]